MPFDVSPPLTVNPFAFIVNFFLVILVERYASGTKVPTWEFAVQCDGVTAR